jgi:hypothetical protein
MRCRSSSSALVLETAHLIGQVALRRGALRDLSPPLLDGTTQRLGAVVADSYLRLDLPELLLLADRSERGRP